MAEIENLLRRAELDSERLSAPIRLVVFAVLATAIFSAEQSYSRDTSTELTIAPRRWTLIQAHDLDMKLELPQEPKVWRQSLAHRNSVNLDR